MFGRMVVFFCFHSFCVGSLNETISPCNDRSKCIRLCCDQETVGCASTFESFLLRKDFLNFTLSDLEIKFGNPCQETVFVDDFEWNFEVNKLELLKLN